LFDTEDFILFLLEHIHIRSKSQNHMVSESFHSAKLCCQESPDLCCR
jgi:hypothetical protein